jgi:predicted metalloprotease with PDZ domain
MNERRRVDYYDEGALIWMEADILIRQRTNNRLSLDDFLQRFHGGASSGPKVVTYDLAQIVAAMNSVVPYDWNRFFRDRVYTVQERAPLGGITNGGWSLVFTDVPNIQGQVDEYRAKNGSFMYSVGFLVNEKGEIRDINPDLAASRAGLAPGMTITRVNGKPYSLTNLHNAVAATKKGPSTIRLEADNGSSHGTYEFTYEGGEKFPHLVRDMSKPDLLSAIVRPR